MIFYEKIKQIHVELSSNCNAQCPNCPRNVEGGYEVPWINKQSFTLDDFKEIFQPELLARLERVLFCGNYGDPVMCVDTPKIVEYIHSINSSVAIRIHTNGGLRNKQWWEKLASVLSGPNDTVIFSIDGLEDTNHIYRRNVVWSRLMENTNNYIKAGGKAVWEYLIFAHNEHQIDEAKQLSKDLGFQGFIPKKAFGFDFFGSNRPRMRVIDRKGNFEYFIDEPSNTNLRNKPMIVSEVNIIDDSYSKSPSDYKKSYDIMKEQLLDKTFTFENLDHFKIDCMAERGQEIYVDSNFGVHPCCFLGHVSQNISASPDNIQYYEWVKDNIGFDNINAKGSSIKEILSSDYFNKIVETWDLPHNKGRIAICTRMCAKNHNPMENLYVN